MSKFKIVLLTILLLFGLSIAANATIISTEVAVDMQIKYDTNEVTFVDVSGNDSGTTQADVYLTGPYTDVTAYSDLELNNLTAEEVTLDFAIGWDGRSYNGPGYIGHSAPYTNYAKIEYSAVVDSVMMYDWDLGYYGMYPFGLQIVWVQEDGTILQTLGNVGTAGSSDTGSDTFNLTAGNDYFFQVFFFPNVSTTNLNGLQGDLIGNISFDFDGVSVPEPATMLLLGFGIIGLAGLRRKV